MSTLFATAVTLVALLLANPVLAKEAAPLAEDPAVEQRLIHISEELRCLVCQNESLAGSQAELAQDLRREVRELIKQGNSDQQVKDFLVSRYGDFVLYRPQLKPTTWLLWGGPFVLLIVGLVVLVTYLRRRSKLIIEAPLSEEDRKRAEVLLKGEQS
ncbi:MAG: cytochrome c-type biogenesis protein CcmH [Gammaproteobacteria bacterium]|nr:cytochrome c-type biogenesis protein CcmH [Rhodocyclaceae bacterium]MBU3908094.1 cytochrome c-type biogenesis protein CcmH [Gammaproteobacteria bacterium]MBU3988252.1 cytochrome c-type biogenesis protein CcmH [Gammaproteobacteria bacterium]MBU4005735.1 cytochrome c-type biogenesis protein CcmH [Gammaproteobacteria bacterium]MBU4021517.1 cytochrome c-type biogenesis protein CcmH [Gammaproteobacteria bacterium]